MLRFDRVIVAPGGQVVVDRLSLAINPGETVAVIGRSGAGKSALLAALATAIPLQGGDITVAGHSVRHAPDAVRSRIGYAPAHLTVWPAVRADEFLQLFAVSAGLHGRVLHAAVDAALEMTGLTGRGGTLLDHLPLGQAKRLLIARALLHAPDVLVLDDPCGNLDPHERQSVERLIGDMQIGGRIVIAAIDDARVPECFTHLAVLSEGRLVHQGPATFVAFAAGRSWRYRLHCPGQAEAAAALIGRLADRVEALDATILDCTLAPPPVATTGSARATHSDIIAALVRARIAVEAAGIHPHWTEQLIEPMA